MTREEIVALFARRQDALDRHDAAAVASEHDDTCLLESPMVGKVTGRAAIAKVYESLFTWFPDFVFTSEELLIDGDCVAQLGTFAGTDTGGFMGLPPTGKPMRVPGMFLYTLNDRHIVHQRTIYDFTGMLVQNGVLKAKPA